MVLTILASLWLLASAGIGFWIAHDDFWGKPETQDQKRKFAYHLAIKPAAVIAIYLALGWQVALASSLLLGWVLRWLGLGLVGKRSGLALMVGSFLIPIYFGYCIVFNHVEPLRYLFAFLFILVPFTQLRKDKHFQSVLQTMGIKSRKILLLVSLLFVFIFLGLVELVWQLYGIDGWIWFFAYFPLIAMLLTVAIVVPLAHRFPDMSE